MKFKANVHVLGMKKSKGVIEESGMAYDSTKVYVLQDMDATRGDAKGHTCTEYALGTSEEFGKYAHLPFPFQGEAEFEIVSNGKTSKTRLVALVPTDLPSKAKA